MGFKTEISKLHYNKQAKGLTFNFLKFCSLFYAVGSSLRNKLYDKNILKPKRVDAFVISVGNLTTGGVGKTPVVAAIANYLTDKGEKIAIISRGYGSELSKNVRVKNCCAPLAPISSEVNVISNGERIFFDAKMAGDEPHWLSENTKAVVITAKNRYEGATYAVRNFGATKIILDDGFQHRKLHRDLDVVLIDSKMGFGNENLLPAGPLREGLEAFSRIDKLVVVSKNTDHSRAEKYAKIMGKKLKKDTLVCYSEPDYAYNIFNEDEKLQTGEEVVAFCAIGQPKQFYNFLTDYKTVKTIDFDDHHVYTQADVDNLCAQGISTLVTTEKDGGKLLKLNFDDKKIFALKLKTKFDVETLLNENR